MALGDLTRRLQQTQGFETLVIDAAGEKFVQCLTEGQIFDAIIVIEAMLIEVVIEEVVTLLHPVDAAPNLPHGRVLPEAVDVKILCVLCFHTRTGFLLM